MISRRQFTKTLCGAVTLTAIKPDALWSGEPTATATSAPASPVAAELYRKAFVLDGNVLGAIGFPISDHDHEYRTKTRARDRCVVEARVQERGGRKILGGNFKRVLADIWST
jgi:hypothetical protein